MEEVNKLSDIDTQEILLYTCVVPDEGSVSCTMLVEATRWWVCCWCVLLRVCTEVAIAGAASPPWEPPDNGSTADPFSSTILSIAWEPQTLKKIETLLQSRASMPKNPHMPRNFTLPLIPLSFDALLYRYARGAANLLLDRGEKEN